MSILSIKNLCKVYSGKMIALDSVSIDMEDNGFLILLGPGGSGKSVLLKTIAGIEKETSGDIYIDRKSINQLDPVNRGVSIILKNYVLYPNMTVKKNVEYSLVLKGYKREMTDGMIMKFAKVLGIEHLLDKVPEDLTQSEKNSIIFLRTLVTDPKVILIDDAFNGTDLETFNHTKDSLLNIHNKIKKTFIYSTENPQKALKFNKRIAVINKGRIQQIGFKEELLSHPANCFVLRMLYGEKMNIGKAVLKKDDEGYMLSFLSTTLRLPRKFDHEILQKYVGKSVWMAIDVRDIYCNEKPEKVKSPAIIHTRIKVKNEQITHKYYQFELNFSRFNFKPKAGATFKDKDKIDICFDMDKVFLFNKQSEKNLFM